MPGAFAFVLPQNAEVGKYFADLQPKSYITHASGSGYSRDEASSAKKHRASGSGCPEVEVDQFHWYIGDY